MKTKQQIEFENFNYIKRNAINNLVQRLYVAQKSVQWTAIATGGLGLLVGFIIGWFVFRG